jgi:LmbE family N-acetylglucosaminyl deacetylase
MRSWGQEGLDRQERWAGRAGWAVLPFSAVLPVRSQSMSRSIPVALAAALAVAVVLPRAQMRVVPVDEQQGHVALGLTLRHLANVGIVMEATAHPDDEDNGLLVMLNRGQGFRTALVTATRGNGGQNEIGPEIFEALGVLRTEELAALHRFDGAEQYFTRAVDFGFSFSIEETFQKWGRDEITADFVRMIRTIRPDVIFGMSPLGNNGGQHHNASAVISHDAYLLAGDPAKYPEQIKEGLRPWQAKKYYWTQGFGPPNANAAGQDSRLCRINSSVYDELLGRTYSEIGTEARSMHKCQGMAQLLALPGPVVRTYRLVETIIPGQMQQDEKLLTDGIDTSLASLSQFALSPSSVQAGARPPKDLVEGLAAIAAAVQSAQRRFDAGQDDGAVGPLISGLHALRVLRAELRAMALDDAARFEIDFRLRQKEREFQQAIIVANALRIDALSDDGVVVPGQDVKLSLIVANNDGGEVTIRQAKFSGFTGDGACALNQVTGQQGFGGRGGRGRADAPPPVRLSSLKKDVAGRCDVTMKIPANARVSEPYWHRKGEEGRYTFDPDAPFGLPFRPTEFYGEVTLGFPGVPGGPAVEEVFGAVPVQYRYSGDIFSGEKRSDLLIVPALSVRVTPEVAIIPAASLRQPAPSPAAGGAGRGGRRGAPPAGESREVRVTVVNGSPGASESTVSIQLPQGWTSTPAEQPLKLARSDDSQTLRFLVKPPPGTKAGEYRVRAVVKSMGATFDRGYQVIEYPHIRRQHIYDEATATIKVIDVNTLPNLTIGYVMGVGDQVPPAIEQLGARVEFITADDLAWGNLSRFDAIVTGVRAYERRMDLRANNARLLEYVGNGGTVIVQYNKFEFNEAQFGPYPAKVSNDRVTDEHAPVKVLNENSPLLNAPNRINEETWNGWVQERGLYFLDANHDSRYKDLLEIADPFENNPGAKKGALVETQYGKGRWVYVGLGLWRELPAGVDGSYQLLANLISLGKTSSLPSPSGASGRGK